MILKPIEHNDPTPSPNLEFFVFEAEEDDVEGDSWWDYPTSWAQKKAHSAVSWESAKQSNWDIANANKKKKKINQKKKEKKKIVFDLWKKLVQKKKP